MSGSMAWVLAALAGELVLLLLVLLALSWFRNRAVRRRDAKAMQALVGRIRQGKAEREAVLADFLHGNFGLDGEALSVAAHGLLRSELALLQRFVGVYSSRDAEAAAQFDIDVGVATAPYHALTGTAEPAVEDAGEDRVDRAELDALEKENQRLSDELRITMETMSRMLNEYSSMFAGAPPDSAAPIGRPGTEPGDTAVSLVSGDHAAADHLTMDPPDGHGDGGVAVVVEPASPADAPAEPARAPSAVADGDAAVAVDLPEATASSQSAAIGDPDRSITKDYTPEDASTEGAPMGETQHPPAADESSDILVEMPEEALDSLFDEPFPEDSDVAALERGTDVEVMSELLLEGESQLVAADGTDIAESGAEALMFDADGDLFDAAADEGVAASAPDEEDRIDDLFDVDESQTADREKAG